MNNKPQQVNASPTASHAGLAICRSQIKYDDKSKTN